MCNRYRPASVTRIRDAFGFTHIEAAEPMQERYKTTGIGPLQAGPFVHRDGLAIGQWGLTPDGSESLRPKNKKTSRPMSTNNARWDSVRGRPEAWSFLGPWARGQRCIVPAEDFDEPYWPDQAKKCTWWRFQRADGQVAGIAGLWNEWKDPETGELVPSYTMLTINCNAHPVLSLMHRPDVDAEGKPLPAHLQDKRTIVILEREHWDTWLRGSADEAARLIRLPEDNLYAHGAVDSTQQVSLPLAPERAS